MTNENQENDLQMVHGECLSIIFLLIRAGFVRLGSHSNVCRRVQANTKCHVAESALMECPVLFEIDSGWKGI